jgi:hypothetical protein
LVARSFTFWHASLRYLDRGSMDPHADPAAPQLDANGNPIFEQQVLPEGAAASHGGATDMEVEKEAIDEAAELKAARDTAREYAQQLGKRGVKPFEKGSIVAWMGHLGFQLVLLGFDTATYRWGSLVQLFVLLAFLGTEPLQSLSRAYSYESLQSGKVSYASVVQYLIIILIQLGLTNHPTIIIMVLCLRDWPGPMSDRPLHAARAAPVMGRCL